MSLKNFFVTSWNVVKYWLIHQVSSVVFVLIASFFMLGYYVYEILFKGISMDFEVRFEDFVEGYLPPLSFIFGSIIAFAIFFWMLKRKKRSIYEVCRFNKIPKNIALVSLLAGIGMASTDFLLVPLASMFIPESLESYNETMGSVEQGGVLLLFLTVVVIAPLIEEIIFRGLMFDELEKKTSIKFTVIVQGVLFGLMHLNIIQGVSAAISGIYYGLLLIWTGSIWAPIIAHCMTNFLALLTNTLLFQRLADQYSILFMLFISISILVILPLSTLYLYKRRVNFIPRKPIDIDENSISV